jgi:hypothetical protein
VIAIAHAIKVADGGAPAPPSDGGGRGEQRADRPLPGHGVDLIESASFGIQVLLTWVCKFCRRIYCYSYV